MLPPSPPRSGEPLDAMLADFASIVVPGTTEWNHPGSSPTSRITGAAPCILGGC